MNLPQIRLQTQQAKINMTTTPPQQSIEQPQTELDLQNAKLEMEIERTPAKLTIDQTKAWEDMDLKHIFRRIEEAAQLGYEDWLEGIARRARQGDELMRIEEGGNPIADQAKVNSETPPKEFNIGWVPSHFSVKIHYEPGDVNIKWRHERAIINAKINAPKMDYNPGKVEIQMAQYPDVKVDFENLTFKGINFEMNI
ncbi:DUF6470 family protein [Bacillus alveayuensis]|uniref:DUF6470 family protein n=1 Tax=Aeribacillus alveayuensis TaxID=279215 RepID=UPI0005D11227|nr:DUF6470 family protein [Bacillus alveayuensis]